MSVHEWHQRWHHIYIRTEMWANYSVTRIPNCTQTRADRARYQEPKKAKAKKCRGAEIKKAKKYSEPEIISRIKKAKNWFQPPNAVPSSFAFMGRASGGSRIIRELASWCTCNCGNHNGNSVNKLLEKDDNDHAGCSYVWPMSINRASTTSYIEMCKSMMFQHL